MSDMTDLLNMKALILSYENHSKLSKVSKGQVVTRKEL